MVGTAKKLPKVNIAIVGPALQRTWWMEKSRRVLSKVDGKNKEQ